MRCVEYYDKCEREGCDWCEKDEDTVRTIKRYIEFYKELETLGVPRDATIVGIAEGAIRPLFSIQDKQIREKAIIKCSERLNPNSVGGRGNTKKLTEAKIKEIIEDIEIEVRNEKMDQVLAEKESEEERTGIKEITQEEVQALLATDPKEESKATEPIINKQGNQVFSEIEVEKIKAELPKNVVVNTIMQFEIDLYFEIMEKIGCVEDIPKHKKRLAMMLENKTLLVVG